MTPRAPGHALLVKKKLPDMLPVPPGTDEGLPVLYRGHNTGQDTLDGRTAISHWGSTDCPSFATNGAPHPTRERVHGESLFWLSTLNQTRYESSPSHSRGNSYGRRVTLDRQIPCNDILSKRRQSPQCAYLPFCGDHAGKRPCITRQACSTARSRCCWQSWARPGRAARRRSGRRRSLG